MNRTVKALLVSDVFLITGFGLTEPILAIFIKDNLAGGEIYAAGIASMLFLLTKSLVQLPFSRYVDKHEEKVRWLIVGTLFITLVPFIYILSTSVMDIFFAQIVFGIGAGLAYPTWLGLWSAQIDAHHESFEWSLYSTLTGFGAAIMAAGGAFVAEYAGFNTTFALTGALSIIGCLALFWAEDKQHRKKKLASKLPIITRSIKK